MALFCLDPGTDYKKHVSRMDKLRALFNGEKVHSEGKDDWFGKHLEKKDIGVDIKKHYGDVRDDMGIETFRKMVYRATYKPVSDDFTDFSKGDYRRIANEIEFESKQLRKGGLSFLEKLLYVKRGTMRKFAITQWLNDQINKVTNHERTYYSKYIDRNSFISKLLRKEIMSRDGQNITYFGIKAGRDLDKLERKMSEVSAQIRDGSAGSNRKELQDELLNAQDEIVRVMNSEGGRVLHELIAWLETPEIEGQVKEKPKHLRRDDKDIRYSSNVVRAGVEARRLLDDMGGVLTTGLREHIKLMQDLYLNGENPKKATGRVATRLRWYEKNVNKQIRAIEEGMKGGNYFPHYMLEGFGKLENHVKSLQAKENHKALLENADNDIAKTHEIISEMKRGMHAVPASAKFRSTKGYDSWMRNPLAVLRRYSMDAIAFNKHQHIHNAFQKVWRQMPVDSEITEGLGNYLRDIYQVSTKGWQDRNPWVNKAVRIVTGVEFLSKIGFGVATAARNMLSGMYFIQGIGNRAFYDYATKFSSDRYRHIANAATEAEKEAGFRFEDMSYDLYQEGLLPTRGVITKEIDIKIDPTTKEPYMAYNDGTGWAKFDTAFAWMTGKGAVLQRITENTLRKNMWRAAFFNKYRELEMGGMTNEKSLVNASKTYALDMVNKYAFEYAAHQKAPLTGGTAKDLGAVGQVAFQFFHFPFSFLQMQSEILRKSKDAMIAGQWNHPDAYIPLKFAGLYMFTRLTSGVTNLDLHNLMENDTVERIRDLVDVVNGDKEDIKGRGYLGPAAGDLFFLASMFELIKMPDNRFVDLIVGYNNAYKLTDPQKQSRLLSTLNVEVSKIITRDIPSLRNSDGLQIIRHEFGLYPRAWTKEMHENIWGKKKSRRKKKTAADIAADKSKKHDKEMQRLYRAMGV